MKVNILITYYDKEEFIPYLLQILNSYKTLEPTILQVYTGSKQDVKADLKYLLHPSMQQQRDYSMLMEGIKAFKQINENKRFLKLNSNTWPLDETKLIDIFNKLDELKLPIASNYWNNNQKGSLATDILLMDLNYGHLFTAADKFYQTTEITLDRALQKIKKEPLIIEEREPVHWKNLWECQQLKWTMYSNLNMNIERSNDFLKH
jgi:hypothetical protein